MANTTQHVIQILTQSIGIENASSQINALNKQLNMVSNMKLNVTGFDQMKRAADGTYTAIARLTDATGKLTGTVPVSGLGGIQPRGPAGLFWHGEQIGWRKPGGGFPSKKELGEFGRFQAPKEIPTATANMDKLKIATAKATEANTGMIASQAQLAIRAAAVIPIWMALRSAYSGLISVISEGIQTWKNFEFAMLKAREVIHDTAYTAEQAYSMLEKRIRTVSDATGTSLEKLSSSFYRFGTVGINFEDSMAGMEASNRAALAMFGDVDDIAQILSRTYKLLGDSMDQTIPPQERMTLMAARLNDLWKFNAFEISEMTESLRNFLPTANVLNYSYEQTISLLAALNSASVTGARGGRLLRSSLGQLTNNMDELGLALGVSVNPELESNFDILMKVLGAMKKMETSGGLSEKALSAIRKVFGGVRGGEPIKALISLFDQLQKNIEVAGREGVDSLKELEAQANRVTDSLKVQEDRYITLKKQAKEAFMQGLLGGNDFTESIKNLNDFLSETIFRLKIAGTLTSGLTGIAGLTQFGGLYGRGVSKVGQGIFGHRKEIAEQEAGIDANIIKQQEINERNLASERDKQERDRVNQENRRRDFLEAETSLKIKALDKENKYRILGLQGLEEQEVLETRLYDNLNDRVDIYNSLSKKHKEDVQLLDTEVVYSLALNHKYEELGELLRQAGIDQKEILNIAESVNNIEGKRLDLLKENIRTRQRLLVDYNVEMMRDTGAMESQILKYKIDQVKANKELLTDNEKQLKLTELLLQKDIARTKEKRLSAQSVLGSETMKLYDIAQTEGIDIARLFGQVLGGETDFSLFSRRYQGTKEFDIFQEQFADIVKQQQALAFFKGERVPLLPELRGGTRIPIQEEFIRNPMVNQNIQITLNIYEANKKAIEEIFKDEAKKIGSTIQKSMAEGLFGPEYVIY